MHELDAQDIIGFQLSVDILIHIFRNLDAKDILRVRQASRFLCRATKFKSLWLVVLDRACERYGIFKPTFPLDKMSTLDLENASTSPYKFLRSIKGLDEGDYPVPYHTSVLRFHTGKGSTGKSAGHDVKTLHLIPGGRFLLTSGPSYCLWDLGYSANVAAKPFPFAEPLYLESSGFGAVVPGSDGKSIILGTTQRHEMAPQHYSINIHTLDVTETPTPTFRLAATLLLGVITGPVRMYHPYVVLWNWADGVACKWYVDKLTGIEPQAFVTDKCVFLRDQSSMRV